MTKFLNFDLNDEIAAKNTIAEWATHDQALGYHENFYSPDNWPGVLGQRAFFDLYPRYIDNTETLSKFDFYHFLTREMGEIKTRGGNYPWKSYYNVSMDARQWNTKPYQLIVYCYYCFPTKVLLVLGWNKKEVFAENIEDHFFACGTDMPNGIGWRRIRTCLWYTS